MLFSKNAGNGLHCFFFYSHALCYTKHKPAVAGGDGSMYKAREPEDVREKNCCRGASTVSSLPALAIRACVCIISLKL